MFCNDYFVVVTILLCFVSQLDYYCSGLTYLECHLKLYTFVDLICMKDDGVWKIFEGNSRGPFFLKTFWGMADLSNQGKFLREIALNLNF